MRREQPDLPIKFGDDGCSDKENKPSNKPHPKKTKCIMSGLVTPSNDDEYLKDYVDDFMKDGVDDLLKEEEPNYLDDQDDDFLLAASQQIINKEQATFAKPQSVNTDEFNKLKGEVTMLRDSVKHLELEKINMITKSGLDQKEIEGRFKREVEHLKTQLHFRNREVEEMKMKMSAYLVKEEEGSGSPSRDHSVKRPRLSFIKPQTSSSTRLRSETQTNSSRIRIPSFSKRADIQFDHRRAPGSHNEDGYSYEDVKVLFFELKWDCLGRVKRSPEIQIQSLLDRLHSSLLKDERKWIMKVLTLLQTENICSMAEKEVARLMVRLKKDNSEELRELICASGFSPQSYCETSNNCKLTPLLSQTSPAVLNWIQLSFPLPICCYCSEKVLILLCRTVRSSIELDPLSQYSRVKEKQFLQKGLMLLQQHGPHFSDMILSSYCQHLIRDTLNKASNCKDLSALCRALVNVLYEQKLDSQN